MKRFLTLTLLLCFTLGSEVWGGKRCPQHLAALKEAGFDHLNYGEKSGVHKTKLWEILGEAAPQDQYRRAKQHVRSLPRPDTEAELPAHAQKMAFLLHDLFIEIERDTDDLLPKEQWAGVFFETADHSFGYLGKLGPILIVRRSDAQIYQGNRKDEYQPFSQWTPNYDTDLILSQ